MRKIVVLMCLVGMTAIAQKGEKQQRSGIKQMTPDQMATLKTKKMTLALDLSVAQQAQIQALNLGNAKTRKAAKEQRKARKENKESKKPTSDERYAIKNNRLDKMIALKSQMKNILSPEQYDKWSKMKQRKGNHRKGKHKRGKKSKRETRK